MKTALELLGDDGSALLDGVLCAPGPERDECDVCKRTLPGLELLAQRAREEMREMAAKEIDAANAYLAMLIRKLPVAP